MEELQPKTVEERAVKTHPIRNSEIFGSFFLSGSEFAISVDFVQEVVNPPGTYTNLPLSPDYLVGLFNLRGAIIPVVDLQKLLSLKSSDHSLDRKIAILELDGHCIGLLFDRTGEIFKGVEEEKSEFLDEEDRNSCIQGVFKKEEGKRIVQILNVSTLFKLDKLPKPADHGHRRSAMTNKKGSRKQCISFTVGPAQCALGISEIQEIIKIQKLTDTALATGNCVGAFDLRGVTVPIIDFGALLKYRKPEESNNQFSGNRRVVVLRLGDELFGLLVDSVNSIVTYYSEDLKSFPMLTSERFEMFEGCISIEGKDDTLLLDVKNIFTNDEVQQITHGHSQIYKSKRNEEQEKVDKSSRRTFITFKVENNYAVQIEQIKEIIEYPSNILKPPGLTDAFHGVYNLRGDLILIVGARQLYSQSSLTDGAEPPKVLVFKMEDLHFGLVVDSVEAIRTFSDKEKIKLPEILYQGSGLSEDVAEAVQFREADGKEQTLLIFSPESIAKRVISLKAA